MLRSLLIIVAVVLVAAAAAFVTTERAGFGRSGLKAINSSLHAGERGTLGMFGAPGGISSDQGQLSPGDEDESAEEPPADDGDDSSAGDEGAAEDGDEGAEAEEEAEAGDESAEEGAEAEDEAAEDEEGAEAEADEGAEEDEEAAAEEDAAAEEAGEDEAAAEDEEEAPSDPIENFKELDPRDIILMKYEDLDERNTEPWDEESEDYIPNTGRVDPLTRVRSSVPDDLKPPRAGETDQNEINTYLVAAVASQVVDGISSIMECHNVIQIGLERYATFTFGDGQQASLPEGANYSFLASYVNNIPIIGSISVTSISTSKVVVDISAAGQGTTTSVSKTKVFIPSQYY